MHGGAAAAAAGGGGGEPRGLDPNDQDSLAPYRIEQSEGADVLVRCPSGDGTYTWDRAFVCDVKKKKGRALYTLSYDDIDSDKTYPPGEPLTGVPQDNVFALPKDFADWPPERARENTKKHKINDSVRVQCVSEGGYYNWFRAVILSPYRDDYVVRFDDDKTELRTRHERIHALAPAAPGPAGPAAGPAGGAAGGDDPNARALRFLQDAKAEIKTREQVQDEFSADVALLQLPADVKELLETQFEYPMANDEAAAPGILLHGKPGCGKTSIAERIAVNGNAAYLQLKVSKLQSHLMGDSEKQLAAYVQACIEYTGPIVLLLDEIDGPFNKNPTENERTLVTCFKETVSVKTLEENRVVVVATTNKVQDIDTAVADRLEPRAVSLRAGRQACRQAGRQAGRQADIHE